MRPRCVVVAVMAAFAAMTMVAQGADVYVGDGATGIVWSFTDTIGTELNPQTPFSGINALAIEADGKIIVTPTYGGICRLDPETGGVTVIEPEAYDPRDAYPDGESGDIYYIQGGGGGLYVLLDGLAPGQLCVSFDATPYDLQVHPSGEHAGHVLVLLGQAEHPRYLAEFERTGPTTFEELDPIVAEAPTGSVAFAIRPDGGIVLLSDEYGMFDVHPDGEFTHFGPTSGVYGNTIDIGADGTIYVTDGEVNVTHRFDPDGNWILPGLTAGVEWPVAVAAVGFTPTPPDTGVVIPMEGVEIAFEEITNGGYTSATATTTTSRTSPGGNTIPDYADPPGGRYAFTYVDITTSAVYENLIQLDVLLPGSRLFHAHGAGEEFRDCTVTGSIEDARGVISRFSEFVLVDDTRSVSAVVDEKFLRLFGILGGAGHSSGEYPPLPLEAKGLLKCAQRSRKLYLTGHPLLASAELSLMNEQIRKLAGVVIPNSSEDPEGNVAGEMLARSKTLMFSLALAFKEADSPKSGSIENKDALSLSCANSVTGVCSLELAGPTGATVIASIYTVGGRLVKTLFDGALVDGRETLVWNGTDDDGQRVASGVYLTRVESREDVVTGKVVFVR